MSSIGKILIGVNLVLSAAVLGAAGALLSKGEVTKQEVADAKKEVKAAEAARAEAEGQFAEQTSALKSEMQRLEEDKNDLEVVAANADRNVQKLEADNQQLRDDITKINLKLDTLESSLSGTMQRNQELTDMNATLREEALTAKNAAREAEQGRRDLEDSVAEANRKVQELEDQIAAMTATAAAGGAGGGQEASGGPAMPHIEATVKEVDTALGFVVLDKGRNQSVERGFTFDISRDGTYVGRVKVFDLYANYATAMIEDQAPNARFQTGDLASTKAQ